MGTEDLQNEEQDFSAAFSDAASELDGQPQEDHAGSESLSDNEQHEESGSESTHQEPGTGDTGNQGEGSNAGNGNEAEGEPVNWQAKAEEWQQKYRSDEGRVSAFQRQAEQLKQEKAELEQRLQQLQPAGQADNHPPETQAGDNGKPDDTTDEQWQEFQEDYPEIAKHINRKLSSLDQVREQLAGQLGQVQQQVEPIAQAHHQQIEHDHYAAIEAAVPDWREIAAAPEFNEWLNQQPPQVQAIRQEGTAQESVWLLNQYKTTSARSANAEQIQSKRKARTQSAATVSGRRSSVDLESEGGDFDSAFAFAAKKVDAKRR